MNMSARAFAHFVSPAPAQADPLSDLLEDLLAAAGARWGRLTLERGTMAEKLACNIDAPDRGWAGWSADPWRTERPRAHGVVLRCEDYLPAEQWMRSELYRYILRPARIEPDHSLVASVAGEGGELVLFLTRPAIDGPFTDAELECVRILLPSVARTQKLCARIDQAARASDEANAAVDALGLGAITLDRTGTMTWRNLAAGEMLARNAWLAEADGRLQIVDPAQRGGFDQIITAACAETAPRTAFLRIQSRDGEWACALISPRPGGGALICIRANGDQDDRLALIRRLFGLTDAEARLAWALVSGESVAEFAAARAVSINTARVQLTSLLRKTMTRRQAELVALLGSIPPLRLSAA